MAISGLIPDDNPEKIDMNERMEFSTEKGTVHLAAHTIST